MDLEIGLDAAMHAVAGIGPQREWGAIRIDAGDQPDPVAIADSEHAYVEGHGGAGQSAAPADISSVAVGIAQIRIDSRYAGKGRERGVVDRSIRSRHTAVELGGARGLELRGHTGQRKGSIARQWVEGRVGVSLGRRVQIFEANPGRDDQTLAQPDHLLDVARQIRVVEGDVLFVWPRDRHIEVGPGRSRSAFLPVHAAGKRANSGGKGPGAAEQRKRPVEPRLERGVGKFFALDLPRDELIGGRIHGVRGAGTAVFITPHQIPLAQIPPHGRVDHDVAGGGIVRCQREHIPGAGQPVPGTVGRARIGVELLVRESARHVDPIAEQCVLDAELPPGESLPSHSAETGHMLDVAIRTPPVLVAVLNEAVVRHGTGAASYVSEAVERSVAPPGEPSAGNRWTSGRAVADDVVHRASEHRAEAEG
jgi:hypothetical protein